MPGVKETRSNYTLSLPCNRDGRIEFHSSYLIKWLIQHPPPFLSEVEVVVGILCFIRLQSEIMVSLILDILLVLGGFPASCAAPIPSLSDRDSRSAILLSTI